MARLMQGVGEVFGDGQGAFKPKPVKGGSQTERKLQPVELPLLPQNVSARLCAHCESKTPCVRSFEMFGPLTDVDTQGIKAAFPKYNFSWAIGLRWLLMTPSYSEPDGWYVIIEYAKCSNPHCPVGFAKVRYQKRKFSLLRRGINRIKALISSRFAITAPYRM